MRNGVDSCIGRVLQVLPPETSWNAISGNVIRVKKLISPYNPPPNLTFEENFCNIFHFRMSTIK